MHTNRPRWTLFVGVTALLAVLALVGHNLDTIRDAGLLLREARPGWLGLGVLAVGAGVVCGGQIYGRVLGVLGHRAPQPWLIAAAMVSTLISQAIPAGTVGSYAFLTTTLRRRGIPASCVALLASLELIVWIGGMLLLFCFGAAYKLLLDDGVMASSYPAAALAVVVAGSCTFAATRSPGTLHSWLSGLAALAGRLVRRSWSAAHIQQIVDELVGNRRLIMERPRQVLGLLALQVGVFALHATALLMLLLALGAAAPPLGVLAAYGLALIVSTFTALPGGGGAVEAALVLSLVAQGVPAEAALGATVLFRLLSFWLLLPVGAVCYRVLTR